MKYWKELKIGILLVGGLSYLPGCTLDDPGVTSSDPPLLLEANQNLSLITLNWDRVKVTGFKEYILLQSTSDIPDSPTPVVSSETTVLKRIDDVDKHSFSFTNTLFAPRLCFKLYTSVGDRFLYSSTLCVDQDFVLINGFNDRVGHEEGLDKVVMYDRVNTRLSVFDYKTATIVNSVFDNNISFPVINVSTFQGTTDVFAYDQSPPRMRKYNYPALTPLTFKDFSSVLYALQVHEQFIFVSVDDPLKGFQILNRSNLNLIDSKAGVSGNRAIAVFEGNPLVVLEIGENSINKYSINEAGKVIETDQVLYGVNQINTENTTANSDEYFIGGRLGVILNRNAEIKGSIASGVNTFISINRFSSDRSKVVSIVNDNISTKLVINDVSALPVISLIASYDIPAATYSDVIMDNGIIYVIGVTFASGQSQTFVLKYPI